MFAKKNAVFNYISTSYINIHLFLSYAEHKNIGFSLWYLTKNWECQVFLQRFLKLLEVTVVDKSLGLTLNIKREGIRS